MRLSCCPRKKTIRNEKKMQMLATNFAEWSKRENAFINKNVTEISKKEQKTNVNFIVNLGMSIRIMCFHHESKFNIFPT
jgi:hypothetical protein